MKNHLYLAAAIVSVSAFAQNPPATQPRSSQAQPPAAQSGQPAAPAGVGERLSQGLSNLMADHRLEDLPPAVQKTIREQSGGQKIADIDRETRTGRTVWEVEFEKDGRNTEIHVGEDGTLIPEAGLLGRTDSTVATRPGERTTAAGTPAGTQTGRSGLAMGTRWEDLPPAVQQKATQFGGKEKVADIDRETEDGRVVYEIEFKREGRNLEIEFGEDGSIVKSNDPAAAAAQGASTAPGARTPSSQTTPQSVPPSSGQQPQQTPPGTQPRP